MLSESDHAKRLPRIPASELTGFLGFHWYTSPTATWDSHFGHREFIPNDSSRMGVHLEPGLVKATTERLGWNDYIYPCETMIADASLDWAAATPDVLSSDGKTGIQIKNQNSHMRKTYRGSPGTYGENDNPCLPPYMLAQVQWEMLVAGASRWYFSTYFGGGDLWIYNIYRDEPILQGLISKAYKFWLAHIDPDGPMERPSDENWNPRVGRELPKRKLKGAELLSQPIPKGG